MHWLTPDRHPMKRIVAKIIDDLIRDGKLVLVANKKNSLIDFTSVLPEMITRAATWPNILKGFLSARFIDDKYRRCPDVNTILSTCRRNPSKEEYSLCFSSFPKLFKLYCLNGHITDNHFKNVGFLRDVDMLGNVVRRVAGISQEYMQQQNVSLTSTSASYVEFACWVFVKDWRRNAKIRKRKLRNNWTITYNVLNYCATYWR